MLLWLTLTAADLTLNRPASFLSRKGLKIIQLAVQAPGRVRRSIEDGWSCKPTVFNWQSMRPNAELTLQLL